jgi:TM2 domain-containing membrane protein YozV
MKSQKPEKHGIPALVNLILPGVGQMMKGETLKGILILIGFLISAALTLLLIGFITTPIIYIIAIIDAYNNNPKK